MKRLLCLPLILLLLVTLASSACARSHRFLDLEIMAELGADGLVRVVERHTVQFDGTFSGMYQWFDKTGGIEIKDIVVSEDGIVYERLDANSPGPANTFFVRETEDELYVDWSFAATDELRSFELSYVLEQAVLKHNDIAEFYYKFVGNRWDQGRDRVQITLSLPFGAKLDEVAAWGHGPLGGVVKIDLPTKIVWEVKDLPERTFVEGRVIFPTNLIPLATRTTGENRLQAIFNEEFLHDQKIAESQRLAQERVDRLQRRKALEPYLGAALFIIILFFIIFVWNSHIKPEPGYRERYYKELPSNYSPAELAVLYKQNVEARDFTATLLHLAQRGFFTIEEIVGLQGKGKEEASYKFVRKYTDLANDQSLTGYENLVLKLLFRDLGKDQPTLEDLQSYAKESAKEFSEFWKKWNEKVKASAKEQDFFDPDAKKSLILLIPVFLFVGIGLVLFGFEFFVAGLITLVMAVIALLFVVTAASRRSVRGHEEFTKWKAFRRYLKDFSRVDMVRIGSLGIWEKFLPYAVTLAVADQMLKQLEIKFSNLSEESYQFGANWFIYYHAFEFGRISHMTNTVGQSVDKVVMPQISGGTGGSFSSGGGGGFGGGGGGVR